MSSSSSEGGTNPVKFHRGDVIRHWIDRSPEGSTSWWIERSQPQQSLECELFWLTKDLLPCSYEETYATNEVEQENSCYLVMAWYRRSQYSEVDRSKTSMKVRVQIHVDRDEKQTMLIIKNSNLSACLAKIAESCAWADVFLRYQMYPAVTCRLV